MIVLPKSLLKELQQRKVGVRVLDADTLMLRQVPIREDMFSKATTNLLVKRPSPGKPYLALVDEGLNYIGADRDVRTVLPGDCVRQGWRALSLDTAADRDMASVVQNALKILGFDAGEFSGLLERFGKRIEGEVREAVGREEQINEVIACLHRREACMGLIVGGAGAGKTSLWRAVGRKMGETNKDRLFVEVNLLELLSSTSDEGAIRCLLELMEEAVQRHAVLAIEQVEILLNQVPNGHLVLKQGIDRRAKIVGTAMPEGVKLMGTGDLLRRMQVVWLPEISKSACMQILLKAREGYGVEIHETVAAACMKAARELPGCFPGKALSLLDAAVSLAVVGGAKVVAADDIYAAAARFWPGQREKE
jgi:hypothetical protein